jgi:DNA repair photolyase
MSGITDVYQPIERRFGFTRQCLEVFAEFRNPVAIITKNHLVTRDIDLLSELAKYHAASVCLSLTTLDPDLAKTLEPRASTPNRRLAAIRELSAAGVPVRVLTAPMIPGLTDHEIPALLAAAKEAGAIAAGYTLIRLPLAVEPIFAEWLERNRPGEKEKILGRIKECRGGVLYRGKFGERMQGVGAAAERLAQFYAISARRAGFPDEDSTLRETDGTVMRTPIGELSTAHFRVPTPQLSLFNF